MYFGENEDAFDECLSDLELLPRGAGFLLVIVQPEEVLADAEPTRLAWLVGSLRRAAQGWARPIDLGEWWDRPAVPFHMVLAAVPSAADVTTSRWEHAEAELASTGRAEGTA